MTAARDALRAAHAHLALVRAELEDAVAAQDRGEVLVEDASREVSTFDVVDHEITQAHAQRLVAFVRDGGDAPVIEDALADGDRAAARRRSDARLAAARAASGLLGAAVRRAETAVIAAEDAVALAAADVLKEHSLTIAKKVERLEAEVLRMRAELFGISSTRVHLSTGPRQTKLPKEAEDVAIRDVKKFDFVDLVPNGEADRLLSGNCPTYVGGDVMGSPAMRVGGTRQAMQSWLARLCEDSEASAHDTE